MTITEDQVKKVARLARLKFDDAELKTMNQELNGILHWVAQLQQAETKDTPLFSDLDTHPMPEREDVVSDGNKVQDILSCAPEKAHGMFAVPKVVE